MSFCKVPVILGYLMLGYIITSIIYLLVSPLLGTPFGNELKKYPKLMKIKKDSARNRSFLFIGGILFSIILLLIWQPFEKCK